MHYFCLQPAVHTIRAYDGVGEGWDTDSYFYLAVDGIEFFKNTLDRGEWAEWNFYPQYNIQKSSSWKYSVVPQTTTAWTTTAYADPTWVSYAPGSFPLKPVGTARYYTTSFTIDVDISKFALFEFGASAKDGIIMYINGQEIYRRNMNTGVVNPGDTAISTDSSDYWRKVSHSVRKYIVNGSVVSNTVILAVELHPQPDAQPNEADAFSGYFMLNYGECIARTHDGIISSNPNKTGGEGKDKAFDNDRETKWLSNPLSGTNSITFQYQNVKREWINRYSITSANDFPGRDPKDFKLYGGDDYGNTWELLDIKGNVVFESRKQTIDFDIPNNAKAYNRYKLEINSIYEPSLNMLQIAEIELYGCNMDILTNLVYEKTAWTWYAGIDNVYLSPYSSGYKDFTCNSPLPEGISFYPTTGEFYGTPSAAFNGQVTVSATNTITGQVDSCTITFTVLECSPSSYARIKVQKLTGGSTPFNERWSIADASGTVVAQGAGLQGVTTSTQYCLPLGDYTLTMYDTDSLGWHGQSNLKISMVSNNDEFPIFRDFLYEAYQQTVPLKLNYALVYGSGSVMCNYAGTVPPNWYATSYTTDASWSACLTQTPKPTVSSRLWLFRAPVAIASKVGAHALEVRVLAPGGVIVYWNGVEIGRSYLGATTVVDATTVPTTTSTDVKKRSFTTRIENVIQGSNTLAVLVIGPSGMTLPGELNFDVAARLVGESSDHSRTFSVSATHSDARDGEPSGSTVDNKYTSRWIADFAAGVMPNCWIKIAYNENGAEYVNKYCFVSNFDQSLADPVSWTFSGCNNDDVCTDLDTETDVVWQARSQRKCFYAISNTQSFNSYKVTFTKNYAQIPTNRIALAEIELYSVDTSTIVVSPLAYSPNTITGYQNIPLTNVQPTANYRAFTIISGTLPNGLTLDSSNGIIHGTPTDASAVAALTIQATSIQGTTASTTVTVTITSCVAPNVLFTIEIANEGGNDGHQMSFQLQSNGQTIDSKSNFPNYYTSHFSYCQAQAVYSLILSDTANNGWGSAYARVLLSDGTEVVKSGLASSQSPLTLTFDTSYVSSTAYSVWQFLNSASIAAPTDNSWTQLAYPATGWSSGNVANFGVPVTTTQYYRSTFTVTSLTAKPALQYTISVLGGAVIYINGQEINRVNMPEGAITSTTEPLTPITSAISSGGSVSLQFSTPVVSGNNVIAIEIHNSNPLPTTNAFSFLSTFVDTGAYRVMAGTASVKQFPFSYESGDMAFDNNFDSKWFSSEACVGNWAAYTYNNNRREFITQYSVTNAKDANKRHPSGWVLEGSNDDGATYDLLHRVSQSFFTAYVQTKTFSFIPTKAYNKYRITFTECDNVGINDSGGSNTATQVSEIQFFIVSITAYCPATATLPATVSGETAYTDCPQYYTGLQKTVCTGSIFGTPDLSGCTPNAPTDFSYPSNTYTFNVNQPIAALVPTIHAAAVTYSVNMPLPNGLNLDPNTGIISGTPTVGANLNQYTITATNSAGSAEFTLQISIAGGVPTYCAADGEWPQTLAGQTANLACPTGQTGIRSRTCNNGNPPVWSDVVSTCTTAGDQVSVNYPQTAYTLNVGVFVNIIPSTTGTITTWSINPLLLPAGLTFINGIISGTPSAASGAQTFTITATGSTNTAVATLSISVVQQYCSQDGEWPQTARGATASLNCPANQTGTRTRLCQNIDNPVWAQEVNTCVYSAPTISYSPNSITVNINNPITTLTPVTTGYITSYEVSPSLPSGITLNTVTGVISGTPVVAIGTSSFIITARNANAAGTTTISITVNNPQCAADGVWPVTALGQTATISCTDTNKEGNQMRTCSASGVWGAVVDNCRYRTPIIVYNPSTITGYKGVNISPASPQVTNLVSTWSITPDITAYGFYFDSRTGQISGAANQAVSMTFTVTGANSDTSSTATITMSITVRQCASDGVWPATEVDQTAFLECANSAASYRFRFCTNTGTSGSWQNEDNSLCIVASQNDNPPADHTYIRLPITFTSITAASLQPKQLYAIRTALFNHLKSSGISESGVLVESKTDLAATFFATSAQVVLRVEAPTADAATIRDSAVSYINGGQYITAVRTLDSEKFGFSTASIDANSATLTNHNSMTAGMIVLIVVVVIFVIVAVAIIAFCIVNRNKSKSKSHHKKLGNVPKASKTTAKKNEKAVKV